MEYLTQNVVLPYLRERFQLTGTIKARVLHVAGVGESTIDDWIGDLETSPNPTVGLLAHPGQVDVRITASAPSLDEANQLIEAMEAIVRQRISEGLYGSDADTLEGVLLDSLHRRGWRAVVLECGLQGALRSRLERARFPFDDLRVVQEAVPPADLRHLTAAFQAERGAECALGISLFTGPEKHTAHFTLISPAGSEDVTRSYGGERALANPWSVHTGLELLRRKIIETTTA